MVDNPAFIKGGTSSDEALATQKDVVLAINTLAGYIGQGIASALSLTAAKIDISTSGDHTLIAGVANEVIKVYRLFFYPAAAVSVIYKDGSTALTGAIALNPGTANNTPGFQVLDLDYHPWFTCSAGANFVLNLSGAVQVSGAIYYTQG